MGNYKFFKIFVEGKDDKRFYEDLILVHFGLKNKALVVYCKGKDQLRLTENEFIDIDRKDGHSIFIFDADDNPKDRNESLIRQISEIEGKHQIKLNYSIFLQPDNKYGALEQLLENIAVQKDLFSCFDSYLNCVRKLESNFKLPELDSRTYAYLSALGVNNTGQTNADYTNTAHWDLENDYLKPIVDFIKTCISLNK